MLSARGRRWWEPIVLGALLCVGCCTLPVLVAAGIFGGGVALVSVARMRDAAAARAPHFEFAVLFERRVAVPCLVRSVVT